MKKKSIDDEDAYGYYCWSSSRQRNSQSKRNEGASERASAVTGIKCVCVLHIRVSWCALIDSCVVVVENKNRNRKSKRWATTMLRYVYDRYTGG